MTATEIKNLSDDELRVKVAKLDKWYNIDDECWTGSPDGGPRMVCEQDKPIPDYPHDLNAVHVVEEKLSARQRAVFGDCLNLITETFDDDYYDGWTAEEGFARGIFDVSHATARQRCEALVRTLSK